MKQAWYKAKNLNDARAALAIAKSLTGLKIHGDDDWTIERYLSEYPNVLTVGTDGEKIMGYMAREPYFNDLTDFANALAVKQSVVVRLSESRNATVFKDKIKVGCEEFPIEIIAKLQTAQKELERQ